MTNEDEIVVKVQRMFPNCEKYKTCCSDSGMEEMMAKVKKIHNYEEMIQDMLKKVRKDVKS
jgi:hypothetical protein